MVGNQIGAIRDMFKILVSERFCHMLPQLIIFVVSFKVGVLHRVQHRGHIWTGP